MKRKPIIIIPLLILLLYLPVFLYALPQDLEVFTDFEDISGEGEFFIGEEPNRLKLIGFKVETLEDPSLLHSGSKAITLEPGQEGKIFRSQGIAEIQFYVAETTGGGKIETRGVTTDSGGRDLLYLLERYIVTGLPTSINPESNPPLQRLLAFPDD